MKEVVVVLGGLVATIIVFTLLAGGNFSLGNTGASPFSNFGFRGGSSR